MSSQKMVQTMPITPVTMKDTLQLKLPISQATSGRDSAAPIRDASMAGARLRSEADFRLNGVQDDEDQASDAIGPSAKAERVGNNCLVYGPVMVSPEGPDWLAIDWARSFCDDFFETKVLASPEEGWYGCMASANSSAPRSVILSIGGMDEFSGPGRWTLTGRRDG